MSVDDPNEPLWIPAFDDLGAKLEHVAVARAGIRSHPMRRWSWLAAVAALAIVPGGLALALSNGKTDVPAVATPAPPPLETLVGSTVTCENGDVLTVTEADFRRALAVLPPVPESPAAARVEHSHLEPIPGDPDAPAGYRFVCGSDGEVSVVAIDR